MSRIPRQIRADELSLIGPAGQASISSGNQDFLVRLFAQSSQGSVRTKLQVQVARMGQPLSSGTLFNQSMYTDVGVLGTDLNFTITGLDTSQAYRWRARLMYDPSQTSTDQLYSPWYSMSWGSLSGNADFRTGPVTPATATPTSIPTTTPIPTATPVPRIADFKGQIIDKKYFFVYPNPTRGVNVKFKFFLDQAARVSIKVYTPGNRFVWSREGHYPQGWTEVIWNTSGMANGVYLYIGEAESGHIKERIIKKIGLVK